jgi:hypothetical protein
MYTQDPTTIVTMPLNITDTSRYYYIDVIFPGTQSTVALSNVSTFVSLKPVGSYVSPSTNPWSQQGTSVYYNGGPVGIGGVIPTSLTETLTVNGNTSFVGNVTVTSDASGNAYVLADRVPTGSLHVSSYVTGSVPLTTTTNLIQKYLSNAASITANTGTGTITQALSLPGTVNSFVNFVPSVSMNFSNLALSNLFVEAWVNPTLIAGANRIIIQRALGGTADFYFFINSSGILTAQIINTSGATGATASNASAISATGAWIHVAASYERTGLTAGTLRVFTNGGLGGTTGPLSTTAARLTPTANISIGGDTGSSSMFSGNVADVRVMTGSIVPITTFSPQSAPFTTAPTYRTGMDTGYTSNLTLALQSQYFPGASTSPYGPVLTLPGTVGSYYSAANSAYDTNWRTSGFCLEMWINYASFANATNGGTAQSGSLTFSHGPGGGTYDWGFGAHNGGGLVLFNGGPSGANTANSVITTGSWNHIMVQGNGSNIYMAVNGVFQPLTAFGYSPAGGNNTIAPTQPSVLAITSLNPIYIGSSPTISCPNFAIAKARLVFGTTGTNGNVYSTGNFNTTLSPNFNQTLPAGATIAWQLDSQYPLPTYPSIQDVTPLPSQLTSYGAVPTPIGGVTSNLLSPYSTTYPQLDSIRFDGTGYIDYGNAASSVLTTNLWANAWTIEGWVYFTSTTAAGSGLIQRNYVTGSTGGDWAFSLAGTTFAPIFSYGSVFVVSTVSPSVGSWNHMAATYDGTNANVYINGTLGRSLAVTPAQMGFVPSYGVQIGVYNNTINSLLLNGNLADVRVSNVARYTGTTYVVPAEPFTTDSSTLLLLKSLAGQVGTTLEVQGRGTQSVSLGATQTVRAYPPAPMSSYLLDTTSNALVTYGQGKYIASASSEDTGGQVIWKAFDKSVTTYWAAQINEYSTSSPYAYVGSATTVDVLGNAYRGAWIQLQLPVSVVLSSYTVQGYDNSFGPGSWYLLGSRDGFNWTTLDRRIGVAWSANPPPVQTFPTSATQAYTHYRCLTTNLSGNSGGYGPDFIEWTLNGTEESLCVTSDSKVGVGIANPQRALEVAGDLVVSGTISGGAGMGSFRNRVINGDMRIAQRGTSNVLVNSMDTYVTLDRWKFGTGTLTGLMTTYQNTLSVTDAPYQNGLRNSSNIVVNVSGTATSFTLLQVIEGYNAQDLNWGTSFGSPVTFSFWVKASITGNYTFHILSGVADYSYLTPYTVTNPNTWEYKTLTIPPPPNGSTWGATTNAWGYLQFRFAQVGSATIGWQVSVAQKLYGTVNLYDVQGASWAITGVQLERGTVATPFELRPFAQELALCQRYYQVFGPGNTSGYNRFAAGVSQGTTFAYLSMPTIVTMRAAPTLSSNSAVGTFQINQGATNPTPTSFGVQDSSPTNIGLTVNTTGLTAGYAAVLVGAGSTAAFVAVTAEL